MDLRPGDIVFERSPGWVGRVIRWFTMGRHEPPTRINHVGIISLTERPQGPEVVEALFRVVRRPLARMRGEVEVWGLRSLDDGWCWSLGIRALAYQGKPYGWWKLLAHLIDSLLTKALGRDIYAARRLLFLDNYPICSWLVAWSYFRALRGYQFGVEPSMATPDDIHDHVTGSPDWELVYKREALKA